MLSYPDLITATLLLLLKIKCVLKAGVDQIEQSEALERRLMQKPRMSKKSCWKLFILIPNMRCSCNIISTGNCLLLRRVSGSDLIRAHLHIRLKCIGSNEQYTIENVAAVVSKDGKQEISSDQKTLNFLGGQGVMPGHQNIT